MPVNFQTDLHDLKDYGYVQQIPLEALFKNMGYKQQQYDQAFQKAQQVVDMVGNIPSLGQDTQKKQEIMNNVNQELNKFAGQDLREGNVQASLNGFIGQVLGGKDLQNMAARATKYTQDQKTYHDLQKAGKSVPMWMQTSLNQANDYYGSGVYDPETRFTGEIQVAPDMTAKHKTILDQVKAQKSWTMGADGYFYEKEGVDKGRIANALYQSYTADPELKDYYDKLFDATHADTKWDDKKTEIFNKHYNDLELIKTNAAYLGDTNAVTKAQQDQEELKMAYKSPNAANIFKQTAKQDFLQGQAKSDAAAYEWFSNPDIKVDEHSKLNWEQQKELNVARQKEYLDRGLVIDPKSGKYVPMTYVDKSGTTMEVGGVGAKQTGSGKKAFSPEQQKFHTDEFAKEFDNNVKNAKNAKAMAVEVLGTGATKDYDRVVMKSDGVHGITDAIAAKDGNPAIAETDDLLVDKDKYVAHKLKYLSDADEEKFANFLKQEALKNPQTSTTPGSTTGTKIARPK